LRLSSHIVRLSPTLPNWSLYLLRQMVSPRVKVDQVNQSSQQNLETPFSKFHNPQIWIGIANG
jgi:hypothetical protein